MARSSPLYYSSTTIGPHYYSSTTKLERQVAQRGTLLIVGLTLFFAKITTMRKFKASGRYVDVDVCSGIVN